MAFSWFRKRSGPFGKPDGPAGPAALARLRAEIAAIDLELAALEAEFRALSAAASSGRVDSIPAALRQPGPFPGGAPWPREETGSEGDVTAQVTMLASRRDRRRDLLALALERHQFFREVLAVLRPSMPWHAAGEALRPLCQKAFDLSGFYLARADWAARDIRFPYFYEAGRPGSAEPLALTPTAGLTGWALHEGGPRYLDSWEACEARGMRLTEAELRSGLHTKSWFGAPLPGTDPARPLGLAGFHCYHPQAFSAEWQERMRLIATLAAMHLRDPAET